MISRIIKKTVDLSKIQKVDQLEGPLYQLENGGHTFEITCLMDGEAAAVSGTVSARFLRADEETVYFTGTLTGNVASVTLPQSCYNVNGRFGLVVFIAGNDITSAVYAVAGSVYRSTSDHIIDPTEEIPSLEDLIAKIGECEDATAAANTAAAAAVGNFAPDYANLTFPVEVGTHCTHGGNYYVANTQIDSSEAWTAAHWTQVTAGAEIKNTMDSLTDFEDEVKAGIINLTSASFVSGAWSMVSPSGSGSSPRDIRTKVGYAVKPGDTLTTKPGTNTLYMRIAIFDENDTVVEEYRGYYDKTTLSDRTFTFNSTGTMYLNIANGYNYGNSTSIAPSDMDAEIKLSCFYATTKIAEIENEITDINEKTGYLFNKVIDEAPSASEVSYLYYPYVFNVGQTYIVKIKFSAFSSSTTRKYSLRTTTARYFSASYLVQIVATVDTTAPTIGKEYVYKFTATARESGEIGRLLALELSVNDATNCTLEVYSVKSEDNKTAIDKMSFVVNTDIVSLNHDAPQKILNGLKPFGRATTAPLSLLHFSDIHAAQTNLERLVAMGESLGTSIDDIICTGDMVSNNYSATSMDFWNAVDGAENILMVVGNHDLADGSHGYSSDQIGQTVAYQTYFSPYVSNWGVTMAGENLTYWYKDYAAKKVRLIGLNYLLTGDASAAQKTWLAARLAEAKTAEYAVVIAEHSPLNSFTQIDCNFNIIGKSWGYAEVFADFQSAVQDFIDDGGEFACYIAGHSHCDYVGYNSNYPDQLCIVVTTATTSGLDNDQRRVAGEKSQDAANVVLVDTVTKTVKLVRIGADMDTYLRGRDLMTIKYTDKTIIAQS